MLFAHYALQLTAQFSPFSVLILDLVAQLRVGSVQLVKTGNSGLILSIQRILAFFINRAVLSQVALSGYLLFIHKPVRIAAKQQGYNPPSLRYCSCVGVHQATHHRLRLVSLAGCCELRWLLLADYFRKYCPFFVHTFYNCILVIGKDTTTPLMELLNHLLFIDIETACPHQHMRI